MFEVLNMNRYLKLLYSQLLQLSKILFLIFYQFLAFLSPKQTVQNTNKNVFLLVLIKQFNKLQINMQDQQEEIIIIENVTEEQRIILDLERKNQIKLFLQNTDPYKLQNWYPFVQQFTFPSKFFDLNSLQAFALSQIYYQQPIGQQITGQLLSLQNKIDQIIKQNFPQGCFFKLSTRSPKDYCWDYRQQNYFNQTVQRLANKLREIGLENINQKRNIKLEQLNQIYKFLCNDSRDRIKIKSGKDFIKIFSQSQRIVIDLDQLSNLNNDIFLEYKKSNFSNKLNSFIKVSFRQWKDFNWQNQFRCFYFNYQLTGICSYEQDCLFQQSINQQTLIQSKIQQFFNRIRPKLIQAQLSKGVMDVYFSSNFQKVFLIEINVFDSNTRASLFDWEKDEEKLRSGPLEVRIRKQYSERLKMKIHSIMGMIDKKSFQVIKKAIYMVNQLIELC